MPGQGQFVDVVAVTSPTTVSPSLKTVDEPLPVPVREGRSLSLSTLPRRASTANVMTFDNQPSVFTEEEELELQRQQRVRHARRALSSGSSLSLLQQELGYPTRARIALDTHRHRRSSLLETALENTMAKRVHSCSNGSGNDVPISSSSSSSSFSSSGSPSVMRRRQSVPEPESEEQQSQHLHYHGRSWTFNSANCSPRSDVAGCVSEDAEAEEDENFMNYRQASVTGYSRDADGVVYYEVIVRSIAHGPLSAYKVRRRYSEFRDLHSALSKIMPVSSKKLASVTAMASISDDSNNEDEDNTVGIRFSITDCGESSESTLPPLPDKGGVWSYLQFDSIPLLERRAKYFHAMLVAAQRHPAARASRLLNDFVGTPPDLVTLNSNVENSYVSLNRFAAPKLSFDIEIQERKEKAKSIRRRRSSLKRQSFTGSIDVGYNNSPRPSQ